VAGGLKAVITGRRADVLKETAAELGEKVRTVLTAVLVTEALRPRFAQGVRVINAGRAGEPDDVAAVIAHLASPEARHLTGQVLHVNGGALLGR